MGKISKFLVVLLILTLFASILSACANVRTSDGDEPLEDKQSYDKTTEKYTYNWTCGVQTQNESKNLGTLLVLDNVDQFVNFELGFSGATSDDIVNTQVKVYYDYKPISFKFSEDEKYEYYNDFSFENHNKYTLDLYLNPNELLTDDNIHKLLITITTGNEASAKDLGFSNAAYGTSVIYDVVHTTSYADIVSPKSSDFLIDNNFIKLSDTIYSPQVFTINQDNEVDGKSEIHGIQTTLPSYTTNTKAIDFNSFISNLDAEEDFLVFICLNFEPYMSLYIPELGSGGTYYNKFSMDLPKDCTDYEFTAYTIRNPLEKIADTGDQFINSSSRFTIT